MPVVSRNTSPKGISVFVPISAASRAITPEDFEVRAIVAAALVEGIVPEAPRSRDESPVLNTHETHRALDWCPQSVCCLDDADFDSNRWLNIKVVVRAILAGFVMAIWWLAMLTMRPAVAVISSTADVILTALSFSLCILTNELALGAANVTGCSLPATGFAKSLWPAIQTLLGNTAGAVFGASLIALCAHPLADADVILAADLKAYSIDAAHVVADAQPQGVFVSAVLAGFVLSSAMVATADPLTFRRFARRLLVITVAAAFIFGFELHVGVLDKASISATAAFNALEPLVRPLGPNVFNYSLALFGNLLGAAVARSGAEVTTLAFASCRARTARGSKAAVTSWV